MSTYESMFDANTELFSSIEELKDLVENKTIEIFTTITTKIWDSCQTDGIQNIQNQVCQQTLDFDDAVDAAEATNEGIVKEKFVSQGTVHKIARKECAKEHKRYFNRLKDSIERHLTTKLHHNNKKRHI